jgi:hypothetical protein
MRNRSRLKGLVGGLAVAVLMLFANWPRSVTLGDAVTAAGYPCAFAVWRGAELDSFRTSYLLIDALIAICLIALTAGALSWKR